MLIGDKELKITPASFKLAMDLRKSIIRALKSAGININVGDDFTIDEENPLNSKIPDGTVSSLIGSVLSIIGSDDVEEKLFFCAENRALFGEDKVSRDLFEDPENRQYYDRIMLEVAKVNIEPFIKGITSQLSGRVLEKIKNFLKSK